MPDIKKIKENLHKREEIRKQARRERFDAAAGDFHKLDIVQLEKIEPEFAELILSKGKIIYESSNEHSDLTCGNQ